MALAAGERFFFWSEDVGPEVVDLPFFSDFIDGRRQILVQESTRTSLGRRARCHIDMCVDWPVHRLTKPLCLWCFLGSCIAGGWASLTAFVLAALEVGDCRSLWWLQETLGIVLYFSIS
jgi:hypothetical protein